MLAYYSPTHLQHDPGQLPQPAGASQAYFSEVPARAKIIRAALEESGLATIVAPEDRGREPLQAVHTHALLDLLEHGYDDLMAVYLCRGSPARRRARDLRCAHRRCATASIWAKLGWHCYDTSAPLFAGTWKLSTERNASSLRTFTIMPASSRSALRPPCPPILWRFTCQQHRHRC
ncbi:MAG: hypothetical protein H6643_04820 [Caldilineaceae bacterium]|nr:hypothetical protein [Caldilineaceae bacterium]